MLGLGVRALVVVVLCDGGEVPGSGAHLHDVAGGNLRRANTCGTQKLRQLHDLLLELLDRGKTILVVAEDHRVHDRVVGVHRAHALLVAEPILLVHLPVLALVDAHAVLLVSEDDEVDVRLIRLRGQRTTCVDVPWGCGRLGFVLLRATRGKGGGLSGQNEQQAWKGTW
jgi:hypothetical protein